MYFSNSKCFDFILNNKNCLYIIKDGTYSDFVTFFEYINNKHFNIVRGLQKSHIISESELRLNNYLLSMFKLDFNTVRLVNNFTGINKSMYLRRYFYPKYITLKGKSTGESYT